MPLRYCSTCAAEVEDAGGYCLLGHRLKPTAPMSSGAEMRDEVDRALGEARQDAAVLAALGADLAQAAPGAFGEGSRPQADGGPSESGHEDPPPPPDIQATVWESLEEEVPPSADPITAFAPPSRMDWGPERARLRTRNPIKRRADPPPPERRYTGSPPLRPQR
jgi:hypothetical protein